MIDSHMHMAWHILKGVHSMQAMQKSPAAQKAKGRITKQMKQASMVASGYIIGQFVSFTSQRAIRKNLAVPMQGMMYAAVRIPFQNTLLCPFHALIQLHRPAMTPGQPCWASAKLVRLLCC